MDGSWIAAAGSHHFIGNRWVASSTGQSIDVVDPSDGQPFAKIARGTAADIDRAQRSARQALGESPRRVITAYAPFLRFTTWMGFEVECSGS